MKNIINLTPHSIRVRGIDGANSTTDATFKPSGKVARINVTNTKVGNVVGLPVMQQTVRKPIDLPASDGSIFIVSSMVRIASPNRKDLASPGNLIRDDKGQPIGCIGLVFN